jgi:hypothetical protein
MRMEPDRGTEVSSGPVNQNKNTGRRTGRPRKKSFVSFG